MLIRPRLHIGIAVFVTYCGAVPAAQAPPPVYRAGVDLFIVRVQVTAPLEQPLPALTVSDSNIRIGRRRPPVLHAEQVLVPPDGERDSGPFDFFRPVRNRLSAVYFIGIDPDEADCRQVPRVTVVRKGLRIRSAAWTPEAGCEPPGARIIRR